MTTFIVSFQASDAANSIMNVPYETAWTPEWLPMTEAQFRRIGRFWRAFKTMQNKISAAVNRASLYSWADDWDWDDYWDGDEYNSPQKRLGRIFEVQEQLAEQKVNLQHEYDAYLARIGFSRNDRSLPDHLFEWIANGVLISPSVR